MAVHTNNFNKVPKEYGTEVLNTGRIETLSYDTNSYDERNLKLRKDLLVYLPEGYDASDNSKKYDILYLMHGGGENQYFLFEGPGENTELKNILDHMIKNKEIKPMIIVTPTFYTEGKQEFSDLSFLVRNFHYELMNDIIPAVESVYHTYAEDTSLESIKKTREHRAFGGFSMGGATTWYTFINCLDYFKYYMPLSGDCWQIQDLGGLAKGPETAEFLANVARNSGYSKEDYYIFCSTGSEDIAYPNLVPQIEAMKKLTDVFEYTEDGKNGNFVFAVTPDTTHWWHFVYEYIYQTLPFFF